MRDGVLEGTLVFAAGALALRVAGRRVCGALLASSGGVVSCNSWSPARTPPPHVLCAP